MNSIIKTPFFILTVSIIFISCKKEVIRTYYPNGQTEFEIEFDKKSNIRNGFYKAFYNNGNLKEQGNYLNDKIVDSSLVFYDMLDKKLKRIKYWRNDTLYYVKQFDTLGQLTSEGSASKKGKKMGVWKEYQENGNISHETYFKYGNADMEEYVNKKIVINKYGDTIKNDGFNYELKLESKKIKKGEDLKGFVSVKWSNIKSTPGSRIELYLPKNDTINFTSDFSNWQEIEIETIKSDDANCKNCYPDIPKNDLKYTIHFHKKYNIVGKYHFRCVLKESIVLPNESKWRYCFFDEIIEVY